jgi:hypothetical protein
MAAAGGMVVVVVLLLLLPPHHHPRKPVHQLQLLHLPPLPLPPH